MKRIDEETAFAIYAIVLYTVIGIVFYAIGKIHVFLWVCGIAAFFSSPWWAAPLIQHVWNKYFARDE